MKYSNKPIDGETIYRQELPLYFPDKENKYHKYNNKNIIITCAYYNKKFGFSVQSPAEKQMNRKLSLMPARGRLRKAIQNGNELEYPEQPWIKPKVFQTIVNVIKEKEFSFDGK